MKLMNPAKRSDFTVQKLPRDCKFVSVAELKSHILETFQDQLPAKLSTLGYIEPGHGLRGKQRWLVKDSDLEEMYKVCTGKGEIIFWTVCRQASGADAERVSESQSKGTKPDSGHKKATKYEAHAERVSETQLKAQELEDKHGKLYTKEQYIAWANLIEMGRHESLEEPPEKRFFHKRSSSAIGEVKGTPKKSRYEQLSSESGLSPGKKIQLRSELINQMSKWHDLLQAGAISQSEYDELQKTILMDIKKY